MTQNRMMTRVRPLLALALRLLVFLAAMGLVLVLTAAAAAMAAFWGLLTLGERDFTLSDRTLPFWPDWIMPVDLLHAWSWAYLAAAIGLIFLALPFFLALLERIALATRRQNKIVEEKT